LKKHLVLAGGGHAHMMALAQLGRFVEKGHKVTVIGPSEHHYYSGMGPGMLGGTYAPEEIRFDTKQVVEKTAAPSSLARSSESMPERKPLPWIRERPSPTTCCHATWAAM